MIKYAEKGIKLHEKVAAAGHRMLEVTDAETGEASWVTDDDAAVQAIIDGYTLDETKAEVLEKLELFAKELRDKAIQNVSALELSQYTAKASEAKAFQASQKDSDALALRTESMARGITLDELAAKVLDKAGATATMEAEIAGVLGKHKDVVRSFVSFQDVLTYDYDQGWPDLGE